MKLLPMPTNVFFRSCLLWQDEDLHNEYTAEYEAGAGHVVLEGRQRRGSVLLRGKGENIGENILENAQLPASMEELQYENNMYVGV